MEKREAKRLRSLEAEGRIILTIGRKWMRALLFTGIGVFLFLLIQIILLPVWNYPEYVENISYSIDSFYAQEEYVDDVLFLGTSHTLYGVSPMDIYQKRGFTSYNLGTAGQPIAGSYYLLKDALQSQNPKVVVLDVSSLFMASEKDDVPWRYILDSMPLSRTKIEMAKSYAELEKGSNSKFFARDNIACFLSVVFPIIEYHDRWDELNRNDFLDLGKQNVSYYSAGYSLNPVVNYSGISIEYMNSTTAELSGDTEKWISEYTQQKEKTYSIKMDSLYEPEISDYNAEYLDKIKRICDANNVQLLLIKYPSVHIPNQYASCWTKIKSDYMKEFAERNGYEFLDLLYDVDFGLDLTTDFMDGGGHLNYNGAKKISAYLSDYLADNYRLTEKRNESFENNLNEYNMITKVAELELEKDFVSYIKKLSLRKADYIICLAAKDEMSNGLNEQDVKALTELGIICEQDTFGYRNSFLAVIDGGTLLYEASSNRKISYSENVGENIKVAVTSSGWNTTALASIRVNGVEYAGNTTGLNIVVIDKMTGIVVDSVVFDTFSEAPHSCTHKDSLEHLNNYWMAIERGESGDVIFKS